MSLTVVRCHLTLQHTYSNKVNNTTGKKYQMHDSHFFLAPALASAAACSHEMTLPSITTPLPSMNATRERPSQFLNVSATSGCWGWKEHSAISFDFSECGSSIFLPPVSLPTH